MSSSVSSHSKTNLEDMIQYALNTSNQLMVEAIVAGGIPVSTIRAIAKANLLKPDSSANAGQYIINIETWAKHHKKSQVKIKDVLDKIFSLENTEEAVKDLQCFLEAGGNLSDIQKFLVDYKFPETPDKLIPLLDLIYKSLHLESEFAAMDHPPKTAFKLKIKSKKSYKGISIKDLLIEKISKTTSLLPTLLIEAVTQSRDAFAHFLIAEGFDINAVNSQTGFSWLYQATLDNDDKKVSRLLEFNANPNIRTVKGTTPLHVAISNGNIHLVRLLLDHGADPNLANTQDQTPLHFSAYCNHWLITDLLLNHGAKINQADQNGFTALHYARRFSGKVFMDKLLRRGADPSIRDLYEGKPLNTPWSQLIKFGSAELLSSYFRDYPVLTEIYNTVEVKDRMAEIRNRASHLLQPLNNPPSVYPLEVAFLLQDTELARAMTGMMAKSQILDEIIKIQKKYPQSSLRVLYEALYEPQKGHVLTFGKMVSAIPQPLGESTSADTQKIRQLLDMLDKILLVPNHPQNLKLPSDHGYSQGLKYKNYLKKSSDPGYRNIAGIHDSNGNSFTPLQLREKMQALIADIEARQSKPGTPPAEEKEKLENWYRYLETMLCEIIDSVQIEDEIESSDKDPTPNASTVIEIALMGGHCGGWYMGDTQKIYQQKKVSVLDLRAQIFTILQSLHQRVAEGLVLRDYAQNTHLFNNILQVIDESAGITEEQKSERYYYLDHISPIDRNAQEITNLYWSTYEATAIVDEIDYALHQSHALDRDLIVDWLKEHVPEDWQDAYFSRIRETAKDVTNYNQLALVLQAEFGVSIPVSIPVEAQLFNYFLQTFASETWDLAKYREINSMIAAMSLMKDFAVKRLSQKYGIEVQKDQPLQEQVDAFFISKLPLKMRQKYQQTVQKLAKRDDWQSKADFLQSEFSITIQAPPSINSIIEEMKSHSFIQTVMTDGGRIIRPALIYLLTHLGILQPRESLQFKDDLSSHPFF
jgi:hypothetical protein